MKLPEQHRWAEPGDDGVLAELGNMAGEGMPFYLWSKLAEPGQSAWGVGRERALRESGAFSYRNAVIREAEGKVAATLIGYPLDDDPEPVDYSELPAMAAPLQQLEDQVPGTWYVNILAAYPEFRGRGFGQELLSIAEMLARDTARRGLSIIVSDSNAGARRLYERIGFAEVAQRPMVKEDWQNPGENWVLLLKKF